MARVTNEKEYENRRGEILDAALRLVFTRGYEQMTIQDIINALQISKGAFYHYFGSKQDLLEALVERMVHEADALLRPVLDDPNLPAIEKLQRIFADSQRWKSAQKETMLALVSVWYADQNAILRQKLTATMTAWYVPILGKIIRQGIDEGVFSTPYPDQVGYVCMALHMSLADVFVGPLLNPESADMRQIENALLAFQDAMERVLGAPPGSLKLIDMAAMEPWFTLEKSP